MAIVVLPCVAVASYAGGTESPSFRLLTETGELHRVSFEVLAGEGALEPVSSELVAMSVGGEQVPVLIADGGDGLFGPGDYFEFVGRPAPARNDYASMATFQLTFDGSGVRAVETEASQSIDEGDGACALESSVILGGDRLKIRLGPEEDESPDTWYWVKLTHQDPRPFSVELPLPGLDRRDGGEIQIRIALRGLSQPAEKPVGAPDHRLELAVEGRGPEVLEWDGVGEELLELTVSGTSLRESGSNLSLRVPRRTAAGERDPLIDVVVLNWVEVVYPWLASIPTKQMKVTARSCSGSRPFARIGGVEAGSSMRAFDSAGRVVRATARSNSEFILDLASGVGDYLLVPGGVEPPQPVVQRDRASDLRHHEGGSDYLMIAHHSLLEAVRPLAEFHRSRGLDVLLADVQDIYDEFNHGEVHPSAIRDFIGLASEWEPRPRYVLLVGDASWDVKNAQADDALYANWSDRGFTGGGRRFRRRSATDYAAEAPSVSRALIPTGSFGSEQGHAASDNYFVAIDGDDSLPDLAIGRFPLVSPYEVAAVVAKSIRYAEHAPVGPWSRSILWVTNEQDHLKNRSDRLAQRASRRGFGYQKIYPSSSESTNETHQAELKDALDAGHALVHFVGHGGRFIWRTGPVQPNKNHDLFTLEHLETLAPSDKLPVVLSMTCFSAPFDHPSADSIGEKFLRLPERGAIAVVAASWRNEPSESLSVAMIDEFASGGTIGDAFLRAKRRLTDEELLETYNLLGDPALPLAVAPPGLELSALAAGKPNVKISVHPAMVGGRGWIDWLDPSGAVLDHLEVELDRSDVIAEPPHEVAGARSARAYVWRDSTALHATGFLDLPPAPPTDEDRARFAAKLAVVEPHERLNALEGMPLATWRGGELSRRRFREVYDVDNSIAEVGGERLTTELAKAVYREIYLSRAEAEGVADTPAFAAAMRDWRARELAAAYERAHLPGPAALSEAELRAHYEAHPELYLAPARADIDVLFSRCEGEARECGKRVDELAARLGTPGMDIAELAIGEKVRSGAANGYFQGVEIKRLTPVLRDAVELVDQGQLVGPIGTEIGAFWLRVRARYKPAPLPFAAVEPAVRADAHRARRLAWLESTAQALGFQPGGLDEANGVAPLAAAAVAEGLDKEPGFVTAQENYRSWKLADLAFYQHTEIHPDDHELALLLEENAERFRQYSGTIAWLEGEDYEALEAGKRLAAFLEGTDGNADSAPVPLESFGAASARALQDRYAPLGDLIPRLDVGAWEGPVALQRGAGGKGTLALVQVKESLMPGVDDWRQELLEIVRNRAGSGLGEFMARIGDYWEIVLLPFTEDPIRRDS